MWGGKWKPDKMWTIRLPCGVETEFSISVLSSIILFFARLSQIMLLFFVITINYSIMYYYPYIHLFSSI